MISEESGVDIISTLTFIEKTDTTDSAVLYHWAHFIFTEVY